MMKLPDKLRRQRQKKKQFQEENKIRGSKEVGEQEKINI